MGRIRRSLDYRDCFISRMPEETSGAFWDANPLSPRLKPNARLAIKQGLDPRKYGCYDNEKFAYFFIYEAFKGSKRKRVVEFASVPVRMASGFEADASALDRYAEEVALSKGLEFFRVLKRKIRKYQLIELNGDRLYITGKKEVKNAQQFAFSNDETKLLCRMTKGDDCSDEELDGLFERIQELFGRYAARLGRQLKIADLGAKFAEADQASKRSVVLSLLAIASGKQNMIDISSIGGGKAVGCMQPTFSKELSAPDNEFFFIDI